MKKIHTIIMAVVLILVVGSVDNLIGMKHSLYNPPTPDNIEQNDFVTAKMNLFYNFVRSKNRNTTGEKLFVFDDNQDGSFLAQYVNEITNLGRNDYPQIYVMHALCLAITKLLRNDQYHVDAHFLRALYKKSSNQKERKLIKEYIFYLYNVFPERAPQPKLFKQDTVFFDDESYSVCEEDSSDEIVATNNREHVDIEVVDECINPVSNIDKLIAHLNDIKKDVEEIIDQELVNPVGVEILFENRNFEQDEPTENAQTFYQIIKNNEKVIMISFFVVSSVVSYVIWDCTSGGIIATSFPRFAGFLVSWIYYFYGALFGTVSAQTANEVFALSDIPEFISDKIDDVIEIAIDSSVEVAQEVLNTVEEHVSFEVSTSTYLSFLSFLSRLRRAFLLFIGWL